MSPPTSSTLLKTLTIWLVLIVSNVSESHGSRLHVRSLESSQLGEVDGSHGYKRPSSVRPPSNPSSSSPFPSTFPANPPNSSTNPHASSFAPSISPFSSPTNHSPKPSLDNNPSSPPHFAPTMPLTPSTSPSSISISSHHSPSTSFAPSISPPTTPSPMAPSPSTSFANPPNPATNPPINAHVNTPTSAFAPSINNHSSSPLNPPTNPSTPSITMNNSSLLVSPSTTPNNSSGLQVGFYKGLCPNNMDVEATITTKVQEYFRRDPTLLPALLRMQFHDCFVHGCDASILIDQVDETLTEKSAGPNLSVRGYEFIDDLKDAAEATCPGVVSCADIIAIATKELMKLGGGLEFSVQTGRRDGLISKAQDVRLPSPFGPVSHSLSAFHAKKFTPEEMVVLFGCHTVGISHCVFFQDRLYNETSLFDPEMDSDLHEELIFTCPQGTTSDNFTFLDQNPRSSNKLDNSFFIQILNRRGILPIDQALVNNGITHHLVRRFAQNATLFNARLATVMVKLQAVDVLTGNQGEIRKVCNKFN